MVYSTISVQGPLKHRHYSLRLLACYHAPFFVQSLLSPSLRRFKFRIPIRQHGLQSPSCIYRLDCENPCGVLPWVSGMKALTCAIAPSITRPLSCPYGQVPKMAEHPGLTYCNQAAFQPQCYPVGLSRHQGYVTIRSSGSKQ